MKKYLLIIPLMFLFILGVKADYSPSYTINNSYLNMPTSEGIDTMVDYIQSNHNFTTNKYVIMYRYFYGMFDTFVIEYNNNLVVKAYYSYDDMMMVYNPYLTLNDSSDTYIKSTQYTFNSNYTIMNTGATNNFYGYHLGVNEFDGMNNIPYIGSLILYTSDTLGSLNIVPNNQSYTDNTFNFTGYDNILQSGRNTSNTLDIMSIFVGNEEVEPPVCNNTIPTFKADLNNELINDLTTEQYQEVKSQIENIFNTYYKNNYKYYMFDYIGTSTNGPYTYNDFYLYTFNDNEVGFYSINAPGGYQFGVGYIGSDSSFRKSKVSCYNNGITLSCFNDTSINPTKYFSLGLNSSMCEDIPIGLLISTNYDFTNAKILQFSEDNYDLEEFKFIDYSGRSDNFVTVGLYINARKLFYLDYISNAYPYSRIDMSNKKGVLFYVKNQQLAISDYCFSSTDISKCIFNRNFVFNGSYDIYKFLFSSYIDNYRTKDYKSYRNTFKHVSNVSHYAGIPIFTDLKNDSLPFYVNGYESIYIEVPSEYNLMKEDFYILFDDSNIGYITFDNEGISENIQFEWIDTDGNIHIDDSIYFNNYDNGILDDLSSAFNVIRNSLSKMKDSVKYIFSLFTVFYNFIPSNFQFFILTSFGLTIFIGIVKIIL